MADQRAIVVNTIEKIRARINSLITSGRYEGSQLKKLQDALESAKEDLAEIDSAESGIEALSWDTSERFD